MNLVGLFTAELKATAQAEEVKERQFVILLLVIWLGIVKIIWLRLNGDNIHGKKEGNEGEDLEQTLACI